MAQKEQPKKVEEVVPAKGSVKPEKEAAPEKAKPSIKPTGKDKDNYDLQKVPVKPDTEDRDKYGRNSKGQYLNH